MNWFFKSDILDDDFVTDPLESKLMARVLRMGVGDLEGVRGGRRIYRQTLNQV